MEADVGDGHRVHYLAAGTCSFLVAVTGHGDTHATVSEVVAERLGGPTR